MTAIEARISLDDNDLYYARELARSLAEGYVKKQKNSVQNSARHAHS